MTLRIGYIGLGALGRHLAGSLLKAGFPLTVYDIDRSCAAELEKAGATWGGSVLETARSSDTVITCLPSPEAVDTVVGGERGVLEGLAPGGTWIEMSTNDAHNIQLLAARAAKAMPIGQGIERSQEPAEAVVESAVEVEDHQPV